MKVGRSAQLFTDSADKFLMTLPTGSIRSTYRNPIHLSPPHMGPVERAMLLEAFDSNWIAPVGPDLERFEYELCRSVGVPFGVALSSGTAALHLALLLAGVRPGDEVVVPTLTFAASANAALYCGAAPLFLDVEPGSWCLDPELLKTVLTRRAASSQLPAAVMTVDLYGQCADYEAIQTICHDFGVAIIEDAAEALGASRGGQAAGSFGRSAAFSFNGNKIITTGGGGMLVSHDEHVVERARYLSTQARQPVRHYEHDEVGFNYRMSNLAAAIGRGQLLHLEQRVERRRAIEARYRTLLGDLPGVGFMPRPEGSSPNSWLTVMTIDGSTDVTASYVVERLAAETIEARPAWKPLHLQKAYNRFEYHGGRVAERVFLHGVCLPSGSAMSDGDIERVAAAVRDCWPR